MTWARLTDYETPPSSAFMAAVSDFRDLAAARRPKPSPRDPDEEQGEPVEQDMGADPLLLAVVTRAEIERRLHVPPAQRDGSTRASSKRSRRGDRVRANQPPERRVSGEAGRDSVPSSGCRAAPFPG